MNTRRTTARRVREDVANEGVTPQGNQVPSQVQAAANDLVLVNPSAMTDGEVLEDLFQMSTATTFKPQSMTAQAN